MKEKKEMEEDRKEMEGNRGKERVREEEGE